jgi:hypothetical protein
MWRRTEGEGRDEAKITYNQQPIGWFKTPTAELDAFVVEFVRAYPRSTGYNLYYRTGIYTVYKFGV